MKRLDLGAGGAKERATRFVGRAGDLARLAELEARGERLMTIHGAAGMGKTRLAREYVRRRDDDKLRSCDSHDTSSRRSLSVFVALSEAQTLEDAGVALAEALEMPPAASPNAEELLARVAQWLGERAPAIVVLDNFEQLVAHADLVVRPLLDVPGVTLIVTSREILRVRGEAVLELLPLTLPTGDKGPASEALELLVDRVRRIAPGFDDVAEHDACESIVRELDGLPLALELAAPRVALLGASTVRDRLHDRLDVLAHGLRDAAKHQRTLRSAIDVSWNLLARHEQRALAQCAVFRGSFTFEAIEEIVDVSESESVIELVQSLRERSLLNRAPQGGDPPRFSLYLSIRDYAREKLEDEPELGAAVNARHTDYYLRRAESLAAAIERSSAAEALDQLAADRENIVALVERCLAGAPTALDVETSLRALQALSRSSLARGPISPLLGLLDRALSCPAASDAPRERIAEGLVLRGRCRRRCGLLAGAERDERAALEIAVAIGARSLEARASEELTLILWGLNREGEAQAMFARADVIHREVGDARHEGMALTRTAVFLRERGQLVAARTKATRAAKLLRDVGDSANEAMALTELALCALDASDLASARDHAERAVATVAGSGNWLHRAFVEGVRALVCLGEGNLEDCIEQFESVLPHVEQVGYPRFEVGSRGYVGIAHLELGDPLGAIAAFERSCAIVVSTHDERYRLLFLAFLAAARAASGDHSGGAHEIALARAISLEDHFRVAIDLLGATVDVLREAAGGQLTPTHPVARAAVERLAYAAAAVAQPDAATFDICLALRYARRVLGPLGLASALATAAGRPVKVHADGDWLELPNGDRIDCRARQATRLLLLELVRHRCESPGTPVALRRLVDAAWPGERILPAAAKNRLQVSLTALRKAGLRDLIVTDPGGYFLDPAVPLVWTGREDEEAHLH